MAGCRRLFANVHGSARGFSRALLVPTDPHTIVARMLANLEGGRLASDPLALSWLCELHLALPDLAPDQRERLTAARRTLRSRWNSGASPDDSPQPSSLGGARVMPMFPLGTVLFPYALLPLHVFEPRYRMMLRHVLDADREFGVVLIERGSEVGGGDVRFDVATVARVVQASELPDGRFALATVGMRRVRVERWLDDDPYPRAEVVALDDPPARASDHDARARVVSAVDEVTALARRIDTRVAEAPGFDADPVRAAYEVAAVAPIGPLDAQRVLAAADPAARLQLLETLLAECAADLRSRFGFDQ